MAIETVPLPPFTPPPCTFSVVPGLGARRWPDPADAEAVQVWLRAVYTPGYVEERAAVWRWVGVPSLSFCRPEVGH
jgi:hypothetical protein